MPLTVKDLTTQNTSEARYRDGDLCGNAERYPRFHGVKPDEEVIASPFIEDKRNR